MMTNPFLLAGPALISFSMGRSSARMLHDILDAHGGQLPHDVHAICVNTGEEDERSLRFWHECRTRWDVDIPLIEFRDTAAGYEMVGLNSASRKGEPFDALIQRKRTEASPDGYVPNRGAPYCSIELKARTVRNWVYGELGWKRWTVALGLRHDEGARCLGAIGRNHSDKDPWRNVMPLDLAKVTKRGSNSVARFWLGPTERFDPLIPASDLPQGFDLGLWDYQGNCVFCWKKSLAKIRRLIRDAIERDDTEQLARWIRRERETGTTYHPRWSMEELVHMVVNEPDFLDVLDDDEDDAVGECGFTCFLSDADQHDLVSMLPASRG